MSDYLTKPQLDLLLAPIHGGRVRVRDGFSYLEVHDVKAAMIRVFGFGRWDWEIQSYKVAREVESTTKAGRAAFDVAAIVHGRMTLRSPNGTHLANYDGLHAGGSRHPEYVEALGNALTNADSYAFKRAAILAMGDLGGLGLYNGGSKEAFVRWSLVGAASTPTPVVDTSDVPAVVPESEQAEDKRETNAPKATPQPRENAAKPVLDALREQALNPPANADAMWWAKLQLDAGKAKVLNAKTADAQGVEMTLAALIQSRMKARAA